MAWADFGESLSELAGDVVGAAAEVGVAKYSQPKLTNTANPSKTVSEAKETVAKSPQPAPMAKETKLMIGGGIAVFVLLVLVLAFKD